ncbi:MAG: TMEM165/GDT1 family protein [Magnetospirillum sp.]|nr:TMEM165/GDT1 family protein [Magnetospirillum sp.]
MDSLFVSTAVVAIAEIGDKTQLLALCLAARFRRPLPIIVGILVATMANHALAAWAGASVTAWLGENLLRWILGLSFLAMAGWIMVPDTLDDDPECAGPRWSKGLGPFLTTLIAFFVVEIGDKTQVATVALAARFHEVILVTVGTTLGMMLANVPAVLVGEAAATRVPLKLVHGVAAALFAIIGIMVLIDDGTVLALR